MPFCFSSKKNRQDCKSANDYTSLSGITTIHDVTYAKKQLSVQLEHWEKIKRITKDPKEIKDIDCKINAMRLQFLKYGCDFF
ncbi:hypothetical protein [Chrysodeixis includens nucleopolyhedrovirus]|uniref:Uncharacterized protein n=1 Tax=Chrysodeixis includens nucleopolyhedrovirus TaxID=1207438 RepID=A0A5B8YR11_9ABAC|nr:hypothetical protein QKU06_gp019 [Chrysodeixis includens nucleopolyhedrovirus]QED40547.1 hypothetical protein [Chrysodeixis includens nucleopolyhedrovirus]